MITSEEARNALKEDNMYVVVDFIDQQEKVIELLDLYRLQHEFKERYKTLVRLLDQQECLDTIREIAEEIYRKEKELESELNEPETDK